MKKSWESTHNSNKSDTFNSEGKEDENRIWSKTCQYIPYYILKFEVCENIAYSMN